MSDLDHAADLQDRLKVHMSTDALRELVAALDTTPMHCRYGTLSVVARLEIERRERRDRCRHDRARAGATSDVLTCPDCGAAFRRVQATTPGA